jgi:PAS domain S-box-containing protein
MHYTGMAAMRMPARLEYDGVLVAISVLIAIVAATLALWLSLRDRGLRVKLGAAVAMGLAVAGMHYTAMAAAQWTPQPGIVEDHHGHDLAGLGQTALALSVAAATFLILVFALAAALFDRRFALLAEREAALALRESEARLRLALEGARLGTWEIHVPSGATTRSDRLLEIAGFTDEERAGPHASWRERIHPEDVERAETALAAVLAGRAEAYRVEYRLRRADDGRWVWIESHGAVVEREPVTGVPQRVAGTAQDITERREAEERRVLLAREVDHRAKNALAVVQTMLRLTRADDVSGFRKSVEGRVAALARAQTLLAEERWIGAGLRTLVRGELAPFVAEQRLDLNGPQVVLPPLLAQPLAMALHELATNAAKYGALSVPEGRVSVSWRLDTGTPGTLALRWMETGGPPVTEPPSRQGFGSRVLKGTVGGQLGGKVSLSWQATGLVCDMQVPLGRVAASAPTEALCAG